MRTHFACELEHSEGNLRGRGLCSGREATSGVGAAGWLTHKTLHSTAGCTAAAHLWQCGCACADGCAAAVSAAAIHVRRPAHICAAYSCRRPAGIGCAIAGCQRPATEPAEELCQRSRCRACSVTKESEHRGSACLPGTGETRYLVIQCSQVDCKVSKGCLQVLPHALCAVMTEGYLLAATTCQA